MSSFALLCADGADSVGSTIDQFILATLENCVFEPTQARLSAIGRPNSILSVDSDEVMLRFLEEILQAIDVEPLIIPPQFIEVSKSPIAAGGFAQVHKGMFAGKKVAVKKVFTQFSEGRMDEFSHEVRILNMLKGDPHIILLHGVSIQGDSDINTMLMVLEWCPLSLTSLIHSLAPDLEKSSSFTSKWLGSSRLSVAAAPTLDPALFLGIAKQLLNGLLMLHFKGFVHRDLKPDNILFADPRRPDLSLKLCDFGTARTAPDGRCSVSTSLNGISPLYSPPEAIHLPSLVSTIGLLPKLSGEEEPQVNIAAQDRSREATYDGRKFDMYSAGMILREMWLRETPVLVRCSDITTADISEVSLDTLSKTVAGYRPDLSIVGPFGHLNPALLDLIEGLWDRLPENRPSAVDATEIIESVEVASFIDAAQRAWKKSNRDSDGEPCLHHSSIGISAASYKESLLANDNVC